MKILVTGAAGFIGSALSLRLLDRGDTVIGIDNHNDYYDPKIKEARLARHIDHSNYKHCRIDISNQKDLEKVFFDNKLNCVVNLAAQAGVRYSIENPFAYIQSNIVGFANILEGCRHHKVDHLVYASTSSVHLYQLPTTGLRFFTVYGPWGRPDMAPFKFTRSILEEKQIDVFNYGKHTRDFTYIDDIVEGLIKVIDKPASSNSKWDSNHPDTASSKAPWCIYNIGNNQPIQLLDYLKSLEKVLKKKGKINFLSLQPGDIKDTDANISDLIKVFNYKPNTTIDDGNLKFINWYKQYFNL